MLYIYLYFLVAFAWLVSLLHLSFLRAETMACIPPGAHKKRSSSMFASC